METLVENFGSLSAKHEYSLSTSSTPMFIMLSCDSNHDKDPGINLYTGGSFPKKFWPKSQPHG